MNKVTLADIIATYKEQGVITVEEIVTAYKATGILPVYNVWTSNVDDDGNERQCACGLTVLALHRNPGYTFEEIAELMENEDEANWVGLLNLRADFIDGFSLGFEAAPSVRIENKYWQDGYELGKQARERIFIQDPEGKTFVPREEFR